MRTSSTTTHRARRGITAVAMAAGLSVATAPLALAHDAVVGGSPADGETVQDFPDTLTLDFSGEVQEGFNTFAVTRADTDEVLFSGEPTVQGRQVSLEVPEGVQAEPGDYRIGFQIISSDGHATKGMTSFTYAPASAEAAGTSADQPVAAGGEAGSNQEESARNMTWLWALIGVLAVAAVAAAAIARAGRTRKLDAETPEKPAN
ncbi:copper resistance protein CopC [Corynebacterium qintianiae]|uniref:Copper resistance protein CopC n=1 Tax=Corynebacterium qintianiae TaxID=2709392 RepID=A0A7T0KLF2_9CORY|nr:copper resistance protein CopC [Corynebacterium qintianiae]QPK82479.1 copper resistance protein CopC [Corynebacterium qintianiae]